MAQEPANRVRSDWMAHAGIGLMVHYIVPQVWPETGPTRTEPDDIVEHFSLDRFLSDFERTGARWLIFTIGQNSGFYSSPNSVIEQLAGPGHCTKRDLVLEIAQAVRRMGRRFIAYLPCEVNHNTALQAGFAWNTAPGTDQAEFQRRYTRAIREWALRLGPLLDGWWYDGCYTWDIFHSRHMNWPLYCDASRAGNDQAVLAFNDGCFCVGRSEPVHPELDYLSGEVEQLVDSRIRMAHTTGVPGYLPTQRFVEGTRCQWHALVPMDAAWWHGSIREPPSEWHRKSWLPRFKPLVSLPAPMEEPVYSDEELGRFLAAVRGVQGAVTLNAGIHADGALGAKSVAQLERIVPPLAG